MKLAIAVAILFLQSHTISLCLAGDNNNENTAEDSYEDKVAILDDPDNVVGYGEDCSIEGPFCDVSQNLVCDTVEEICMCDDKNGFVHVGNLKVVPTMFEDDDEEEEEEEGTTSYKAKKICMKSSELEYKLDKLMNITKKIQEFGGIFKKYQKYLPKKYQDLFKDEL